MIGCVLADDAQWWEAIAESAQPNPTVRHIYSRCYWAVDACPLGSFDSGHPAWLAVYTSVPFWIAVVLTGRRECTESV
jgi:hypothetical protein